MRALALLLLLSFSLSARSQISGSPPIANDGTEKDSIMLLADAVRACEINGDTLNEGFMELLGHHSDALCQVGRIHESLNVAKRLLRLRKMLYGTSNPEYAIQCSNISSLYMLIQEYGMSTAYENFAIRSWQKQGVDFFSDKGLSRLRNIFEKATADSIDLYPGFGVKINMSEVFDNNIARQWKNSSDISLLRSIKGTIDNMHQYGDTTSLDYLHSLDTLALASLAVGDFENARLWAEDCRLKKNNLCGEKSVESARTLYIYALTFFHSSKTVDAKYYANEVVKLLYEIEDDYDPETFFNACMLRCSCYLHMGIMGNVKTEAPQLMDFADKTFGKDSPQYDAARFLFAQGQYRQQKSATQEILDILKQCYQWRKEHFGEKHPETVHALLSLANFMCQFNEEEHQATYLAESERLYESFYQLQVENIKENFLDMSIEEQRQYWDSFIHYYLDLIPQCALKKLRTSHQSQVTSDICYNSALFAKGILLNSEILMREALSTHQSSSFNDFTQHLAVDWKEVQRKLHPGEAAVEFINATENSQEYTYMFTGDRECAAIPSGTYTEDRYAAVIITPNTPHPVLLSLFDINDIGSLYINNKLREQYLSQLLCKPILEFLGGSIKTIYFSPIGRLHALPIESLESWDGNGLVSDRINLYRLTSTRNLVTTQKEQGCGAVIYGGLLYDSDDNLLTEQRTRGAIDDLPYLPGTKQEAYEIQTILSKSRTPIKNIQLLSGDYGTDASFKTLNGQKKQIIHIGTHGFYHPSDHKGMRTADLERLAMKQSGLYMSGAIPLSSEEIATIDLRGLDLVTLSACQTALGMVSGDGVFGLQRGFKQAGAQSILMSLWRIDDEATCLLMIEFYRNWINKGKNKHDALEQAKQAVRSRKEKGWDDPKYWAGFILLDALD